MARYKHSNLLAGFDLKRTWSFDK